MFQYIDTSSSISLNTKDKFIQRTPGFALWSLHTLINLVFNLRYMIIPCFPSGFVNFTRLRYSFAIIIPLYSTSHWFSQLVVHPSYPSDLFYSCDVSMRLCSTTGRNIALYICIVDLILKYNFTYNISEAYKSSVIRRT